MKLETEDGGLVLEKTVQAHDLHIHTVNGVQVPGVVYSDIVKAMGGRLKPPDPDVEAAERMVTEQGMGNAAGMLSWEGIYECRKTAEYRSWVAELIARTRREARAEGHAAGAAEERAKHQL